MLGIDLRDLEKEEIGECIRSDKILLKTKHQLNGIRDPVARRLRKVDVADS